MPIGKKKENVKHDTNWGNTILEQAENFLLPRESITCENRYDRD